MDASGNCWDATKLRRIFTAGEIEEIEKIPTNSHVSDTLVWHYDKSGHFTVKSCYHMLKAQIEAIRRGQHRVTWQEKGEELWKGIWKLDLP